MTSFNGRQEWMRLKQWTASRRPPRRRRRRRRGRRLATVQLPVAQRWRGTPF